MKRVFVVLAAVISLVASAGAFAAEIDHDVAGELVQMLLQSGVHGEVVGSQGSVELKAIDCLAQTPKLNLTASCSIGRSGPEGKLQSGHLPLALSAKLISQLALIQPCGVRTCEFLNVDVSCAYSNSPIDPLPPSCTIQSGADRQTQPF